MVCRELDVPLLAAGQNRVIAFQLRVSQPRARWITRAKDIASPRRQVARGRLLGAGVYGGVEGEETPAAPRAQPALGARVSVSRRESELSPRKRGTGGNGAPSQRCRCRKRASRRRASVQYDVASGSTRYGGVLRIEAHWRLVIRRCTGVGGFTTAFACVLAAAPAVACAETLELSASEPRGGPVTITAEGLADGRHRLFLYYAPNEGCYGRPFVEQARPGVVALSATEGDSLSVGTFTRTYTGPAPATFPRYVVCGFLDSASSSYPDVWTPACFWIPGGSCYVGGIPPWSEALSEQQSKQVVEEYERRKEREARERAQRKEAEERELRERAAHEAALERQAAEEAERKARQALRCKIPDLRGHTLVGVRRLLHDARCKLGRITTRHGGRGALVVIAQNPSRGKKLREGAPVAVTLASRRRS